MKFPESWLRSFINPDLTTDQLSDKLTMAGLEVDELGPVAPEFSGVVVAKIVNAEQHPNADRLRVCQVDDGSGELLQIVCGAPNAEAGIVVPLAKVGAELPVAAVGNEAAKKFKIKKAKMRGEVSMGMLCSGDELGIAQDYDGLLLLDNDLPLGQDLRQALDLDDNCFELSLTPNRADCLSILGVAREVSALTGLYINMPSFEPAPVSCDDTLKVNIKATDLCGRFAGRVIKGVNAKASTPDWMASRLLRSGQRPVSVLVDISNYVMIKLGRPTHVFDLDKLSDSLDVDWGKEGESMQLLNEQTVNLSSNTGVIYSGGKPESLAGIMGGMDSSVTLDTTNIYLEGAFWWPESIMGRTRQLKVESEAAHRFERGVDAESIIPHLELTTKLILEICGGQAGPLDDQIVNIPETKSVKMRLARCNKILGLDLNIEQVSKVFASLDFDFNVEDDIFSVKAPSYRFDMEIEEDLIEEVARIYGYDNIPSNPPVALANMLVQSETHNSGHDIRNTMINMDYQEVINYSFVSKDWETNYMDNDDPITLLNPIASHMSVMRTSLIGGLLANIEYNAHYRQSRIRVFELGRVFKRNPNLQAGELQVAGVEQPIRLAGAAWGRAFTEQWDLKNRQVDFFDVKRDIETLLGKKASGLRCVVDTHPALHPGRCAKLVLDGKDIGWLGELHPKWSKNLDLNNAPIVFEIDVDSISNVDMPSLNDISKQPIVTRDLSIWVDTNISYQEILDTIYNEIDVNKQLNIVKSVNLFDIWRDGSSENSKSMALRFMLQDANSTLEDATVDACINQILDVLVTKLNAKLRS